MKLFISVALLFFTLIFLFLGFRLTGIGPFSWVIAGFPFVLILTYMLFLREKLSKTWDRWLRTVVYFNMGFVSFIFGLMVIREILAFVLKITGRSSTLDIQSQEATLSLLAVAMLVFAYGYWNASQGPRIATVTIPIDDLTQELEGFSIAHLSDLHIGSGVDAKFVEKMIELTLSFPADVVVMTGDIADGNFYDYKNAADSFARLAEKAPVLYVTGNHEYYKDGELWIEYFRQLGLQPLLNQNVGIEFNKKTVLFAGVIDPAAQMINSSHKPNIAQSLENAPSADLKILLAHQPKIATEAAEFFHLQLSGHTHGGQFFPWTTVIGLFQKFPKGLMKWKQMWIYVNVGTGFWGPRLRVGTRSEITLIKLIKREGS